LGQSYALLGKFQETKDNENSASAIPRSASLSQPTIGRFVKQSNPDRRTSLPLDTVQANITQTTEVFASRGAAKSTGLTPLKNVTNNAEADEAHRPYMANVVSYIRLPFTLYH
jgi:hypothetical protein